MPFSAKGLLNDTKLTLEKSATDNFGAAIDDFASNKLSSIFGGTKIDESKDANRNDGSWYATSYASALAGWDYRPKLKFMFKVEFIFTDWAIKNFSEAVGQLQRNSFTFMVKQVDRPKIDFEYEEDINMYNFRTKVLKKIKHRELTIVFMDDVGNRVFDFVRLLMQIHQPIGGVGFRRDNSNKKPDLARTYLESGSGMAFSNYGKNVGSDTAHRGVVNSQYGNSIECIRVKQIFVNPSSTIDSMSQMTSFDFFNPRIVSFDFDELSHEANDVSLLTMVFDYDWMEMIKIGSLGVDSQYEVDYNIQVAGVNGAPSDITPNHVGSKTGNKSAAGGGGSPFNNLLSGVLGRGATQLTSDAIGKLAKTVGGGGRFMTALGGAASSALSGPIGGLVQGSARDLLNFGSSSTPNSTNARAVERVVTDSSTSGPDRAIRTVRSSQAYATGSPADPTSFGEG